MRGWLRRRPKPVQQPPLPDGWDDRGYAAAWGIPLLQWVTIPPERQRELRDKVAHAPQWKDAA